MALYIVPIIILAYVMYAVCSRYFGKHAYNPPNAVSRMLEERFMQAERDEINAAALWRLCGWLHAAFTLFIGGVVVTGLNQEIWPFRIFALLTLLTSILHYPILLWAMHSRKYFRAKPGGSRGKSKTSREDNA